MINGLRIILGQAETCKRPVQAKHSRLAPQEFIQQKRELVGQYNELVQETVGDEAMTGGMVHEANQLNEAVKHLQEARDLDIPARIASFKNEMSELILLEKAAKTWKIQEFTEQKEKSEDTYTRMLESKAEFAGWVDTLRDISAKMKRDAKSELLKSRYKQGRTTHVLKQKGFTPKLATTTAQILLQEDLAPAGDKSRTTLPRFA